MELSSIFRGYDAIEYPTVAVSGGKVVFMNTAAKLAAEESFVGRPAAELMGELLAGYADGDLTGFVRDCDFLDCDYTLQFIGGNPAMYIFKRAGGSEAQSIVTTLLAAVSSSLRGPLSQALQALDILQQSYRDDRDTRYLSIIERNSFLILRQLHRFDSVYSANSPEPLLNVKQCDLVALIQHVVRECAPIFNQLGVILSFDTVFERMYTMADADKIELTLLSILSNSAACCHSGNSVRIRLVSCSSYCRIIICDNGGGMSEEAISSIFNPTILTDPVAALPGLGLIMAWGIVRQHGGRMMCETRAGIDTTVTISLEKRTGSMILEQPTVAYQSMPEVLTEFAPLIDSDFFHALRSVAILDTAVVID